MAIIFPNYRAQIELEIGYSILQHVLFHGPDIIRHDFSEQALEGDGVFSENSILQIIRREERKNPKSPGQGYRISIPFPAQWLFQWMPKTMIRFSKVSSS